MKNRKSVPKQKRLNASVRDKSKPPAPASPEGKLTPQEIQDAATLLFGSKVSQVQNHLGKQMAALFEEDPPDAEARNELYLTSLGLLLDVQPRSPLETMLLTQMLGLHNAAVMCLRRALTPGQPADLTRLAINQAVKLSRAFTAQFEALQRVRTGGQQKMVVRHIHVNEGAQAVIGPVHNPGGGGKNGK